MYDGIGNTIHFARGGMTWHSLSRHTRKPELAWTDR